MARDALLRALWAHGIHPLSGLQSDAIKDYLLNYQEALSNDFVLTGEHGDVELLGRDIADWRITFVETGLTSSVGQRLRSVRKHIGDGPFLANYGDVLTDAPLNQRIESFLGSSAVRADAAAEGASAAVGRTVGAANADIVAAWTEHENSGVSRAS